MSIGARIRAIRQQRKMSQSDLAGDWFNRSYISQIELGIIIPPLATLQLVANKLEIPLEQILQPSSLHQRKELQHLWVQAQKTNEFSSIIKVWEQAIKYAWSDLAVEAALWMNRCEGHSVRMHPILFTTYGLITRVPISDMHLWYELMFVLAKSYFEDQRYSEAENMYSALLLSNPSSEIELRIRINLATTKFRVGEYGLSAIQYEKCILLQKTCGTPLQLAKCFHGLGACHRYLNHLDEAYLYTQKAQTIYAGIDEQRWFDANHNLGVILMHQGKYSDAKRILESTLDFYITSKTNQKLASIYEDLGTLAYLRHDNSGALALCHQGLKSLEQYGHHHTLYLRLLCLKYQIEQKENPEVAKELISIIKVLANQLSFDISEILNLDGLSQF